MESSHIVSALPSLWDSQNPVVRKRKRPTLSCNHCKIRKLKCNRTKPCNSCIKTGDSATCTYPFNESIDQIDLPEDQSIENPLVARLDRLEELLNIVLTGRANGVDSAATNFDKPMPQVDSMSNLSIMNQGTFQPKIEDSLRMGHLTEDFGVMKVDRNLDQTSYIGSSHWVSIMCEIEEFRNYLISNHEELEKETRGTLAYRTYNAENTSSLLQGLAPPTTQGEILSYIPPRDEADGLITRFFAFYSNGLCIIHEPTFREEYIKHWKEPKKTKIIWLGLLFAVLRLAEMSYDETYDQSINSQGKNQANATYRAKIIQCLITSNYANPAKHTIETLLLYIEAEWFTSQDAGVEISLVLGMVIRLAMHIGIHRDPIGYPSITPFEGEMRRRIWTVIRLMDILYSFQVSLPITIRQSDCDCALPLNIHNNEFNEDTIELPPARPNTETTEVSYTIAKYRIMVLLEEIKAFVESRQEIGFEDTLNYEQALSKARDMIPLRLRLNNIDDGAGESLNVQQARINLDRAFQTAQCILHRRFLPFARRDTAYSKYRGSCIDAAMTLLDHQKKLYLSSSSTNHPDMRKWRLISATAHDFFVAGMAVALDLHYGFKYESSNPSSIDISTWGYDRRAEMILALETATEFWKICKDVSTEAAKAYGMFSFVVSKSKRAIASITSSIEVTPDILHDPTGQQPMTAFPVREYELTGVDNRFDMDWDLWNLYDGDAEGFESIIQWPTATPEIQTARDSTGFL